MYLNILEDSIFVADSHFNEKNQEFLIFLKALISKEIETKQLFFMGDMIDFISGESKYFIKRNRELIDIINKLSQDIEVVYLEGNHDYNLKPIFPNIKVFARENQPIFAKYQDKTVALAHGDIFTPWHYDLYCKIIRNRVLLLFLNMIDFNNFISKKIYYSLLKKDICFEMQDFKKFAKKRLENYKVDMVIEGHFHQGKQIKLDNQLYVNVPSLCCDKRYFILKDKFISVDL